MTHCVWGLKDWCSVGGRVVIDTTHFRHVGIDCKSPFFCPPNNLLALTLGNWGHHWAAVMGSSHRLISYRTIKLSSNLVTISELSKYRLLIAFLGCCQSPQLKLHTVTAKTCTRAVLLKFWPWRNCWHTQLGISYCTFRLVELQPKWHK